MLSLVLLTSYLRNVNNNNSNNNNNKCTDCPKQEDLHCHSSPASLNSVMYSLCIFTACWKKCYGISTYPRNDATFPAIPWVLLMLCIAPIFMRFRNIAKSDYQRRHDTLFVCFPFCNEQLGSERNDVHEICRETARRLLYMKSKQGRLGHFCMFFF